MRIIGLTCFMLSLLALPQLGYSQQQSWENLNQLRPGQNIQVVDQQLRSLEGDFLTVSEEEIRLSVQQNEVAVQR